MFNSPFLKSLAKKKNFNEEKKFLHSLNKRDLRKYVIESNDQAEKSEQLKQQGMSKYGKSDDDNITKRDVTRGVGKVATELWLARIDKNKETKLNLENESDLTSNNYKVSFKYWEIIYRNNLTCTNPKYFKIETAIFQNSNYDEAHKLNYNIRTNIVMHITTKNQINLRFVQ